MSPYCGRFAPSPTGPLHFGSLVAAAASYIDARAHRGRWLVRIDDADTPRVVPGASDDILRVLEAFGFEWDGAVLYQSTRGEAYREALQILKAQGHVYACDCSRREIGGGRYPGTCRSRKGGAGRAWRVKVHSEEICFTDRVQGSFCRNLDHDSGDFVLFRADGLVAYQLAVVVDDAFQGVTDIVRGADLLDSTPRQLWLQQLLRYSAPAYLHLPVVLDAVGQKLSKQTKAPPISPGNPLPELYRALRFLRQPVPDGVATPAEFWCTAAELWDVSRIPSVPAAADVG